MVYIRSPDTPSDAFIPSSVTISLFQNFHHQCISPFARLVPGAVACAIFLIASELISHASINAPSGGGEGIYQNMCEGEVYTDADIPKKGPFPSPPPERKKKNPLPSPLALAYFSVALSIDAYIHSFHPPPPRKSLSYISAGTQTQSLVLKAQSPPHTSGIGVHYEQYFNVAKLTEALLDPTNPRLSPKQPICTDVVGSDSVEGKYIKAAKLVDGIVSNCDDNISDGAHADAGGQASFLEEDPKPAA
eukprot:1359482-Amorphochlora_amoeboformis.AAC.1